MADYWVYDGFMEYSMSNVVLFLASSAPSHLIISQISHPVSSSLSRFLKFKLGRLCVSHVL